MTAVPAGVYYYVGIRFDPLDEITEQREDDMVTWLTHKKPHAGPRPTRAGRWMLYE